MVPVRALLALAMGLALAAAPELRLPPAERLQSDAIAFAEAQAAALQGTYTFRVVHPPTLPRSADPDRLTFEPDRLSRRELGGNFFATFRMVQDGRSLGLVRVDLEGRWHGTLLRTQTALARRSVPGPGQVEPVDFEGAPPAGALSEFPEGCRLRAGVPAGHILVQQDLETIPVVVAGEPVRLELVSGSLVIAVEALARSSGAVGDKVRLEMPTSRKVVQAVVTGPGEARVQWAGAN